MEVMRRKKRRRGAPSSSEELLDAAPAGVVGLPIQRIAAGHEAARAGVAGGRAHVRVVAVGEAGGVAVLVDDAAPQVHAAVGVVHARRIGGAGARLLAEEEAVLHVGIGLLGIVHGLAAVAAGGAIAGRRRERRAGRRAPAPAREQ